MNWKRGTFRIWALGALVFWAFGAYAVATKDRGWSPSVPSPAPYTIACNKAEHERQQRLRAPAPSSTIPESLRDFVKPVNPGPEEYFLNAACTLEKGEYDRDVSTYPQRMDQWRTDQAIGWAVDIAIVLALPFALALAGAAFFFVGRWIFRGFQPDASHRI